MEQGFIYALMALGLFVSYRILNIADLTVDSSFTLGAAVSAVFASIGHPYFGLLLAICAGWVAGMCTAFLQTKLQIQPILAGILSMTALYSINLLIMGGKSTISLLKTETLFTLFSGDYAKLPGAIAFALLAGVFLVVFFRTQLGLCIRATGDNEDMVRSSSINTDLVKFIGLGLANALVALSGSLLAQYQSFADLSMGIGTVVIGLASLIIGEVIFGRPNIPRNVLSVILGSILYRVIISFVMARGLSPNYLKLLSALIVIIAISYPVVIQRYRFYQLKKEAARNA